MSEEGRAQLAGLGGDGLGPSVGLGAKGQLRAEEPAPSWVGGWGGGAGHLVASECWLCQVLTGGCGVAMVMGCPAAGGIHSLHL